MWHWLLQCAILSIRKKKISFCMFHLSFLCFFFFFYLTSERNCKDTVTGNWDWNFSASNSEWNAALQWKRYSVRNKIRQREGGGELLAPWLQSVPVVCQELHSPPRFTPEVDRVNPIAAEALALFILPSYRRCTHDTECARSSHIWPHSYETAATG